MRRLLLSLAVAASAPAAVSAQSMAAARSSAPAAAAARMTITVPEGTEISAVTTEKLSSKTATEGDRVALRVDEDVKVDNVVVIAKGSMVRGQISDAKSAGRMGRGGKLNLRIESTTLCDGQRINVRSTKVKSGDDATGTTVALTVLFGPIGLLKKGKDAEIAEGTRITLFTDEAKPVNVP
jgi:hypothetical protein